MKHRYVAAMGALLLCVGTFVAHAQYYYYTMPKGAGPYFHIGLGPSFFQDGRITQFAVPGQAPTGPIPSTVSYDTGLAAEAGIGWDFNEYAALGFQTGFVGAEINNVPGYISDNSRIYNVPFLANFTLTYPIPHSFVQPYIGAGVGGADVVFNTDNFADNNLNNGVSGSENDVVFAWQAFAGLRFNISRNMSFILGYKYLATGNPTFTYPPDYVTTVNNFNIGFKGAQTHSVMFALKFDF